MRRRANIKSTRNEGSGETESRPREEATPQVKSQAACDSASAVFVFFFSVHSFIHLETEREKVGGGGGRPEKGRYRIPNRLRTVSTEPSAGLKHTNHEIMT